MQRPRTAISPSFLADMVLGLAVDPSLMTESSSLATSTSDSWTLEAPRGPLVWKHGPIPLLSEEWTRPRATP